MSRVCPDWTTAMGQIASEPMAMAIATPSRPSNRRPVSRLSRMYPAQPTAATKANATPVRFTRCPPSPRSTTPAMATPHQATSRRRRDRATASPNGPRSSIVIAIPKGSRATAWYRHQFIAAIRVPKPATTVQSRRVRPRNGGRSTANRTIAAMPSRIVTTPAGASR